MTAARSRVLSPKAREWQTVELLLCVHGETDKAWCVGLTEDPEAAVYVPKSVTLMGEPCGGFERMDRNCQRKLITIRDVSMPRKFAKEKGLL